MNYRHLINSIKSPIVVESWHHLAAYSDMSEHVHLLASQHREQSQCLAVLFYAISTAPIGKY